MVASKTADERVGSATRVVGESLGSAARWFGSTVSNIGSGFGGGRRRNAREDEEDTFDPFAPEPEEEQAYASGYEAGYDAAYEDTPRPRRRNREEAQPRMAQEEQQGQQEPAPVNTHADAWGLVLIGLAAIIGASVWMDVAGPVGLSLIHI